MPSSICAHVHRPARFVACAASRSLATLEARAGPSGLGSMCDEKVPSWRSAVGSVLTSQLLSVITLLAVLAAPLPMLLHILSRATVRPRVPAPLAETMLMLLVLWTVVQSLVVVLLGWVGYLKLVSILVLEGALLVWGLWLIS